MARVRMLLYISGGRWDGRDWPPANETIEVPDWEAADLTRGRLAVYADDDHALPVRPAEPGQASEPEPEPEQASEPGPVPEMDPGTLASPADTAAGASAPPAGDQSETGQAEGATEPAEPEAEPDVAAAGDPVAAPAPAAVKQAWIDYAVSQGATPEEAAAMTKADLMSRYGGRL
jgi:hypothetical protein